MLSLHDRESICHAQKLLQHRTLHDLLISRAKHCCDEGLLDLTHFLIVEQGDDEGDIRDEIGLSPLDNPLDGSRFGSATFQPYWEDLQTHPGWFEMIIAVGNSGFAFALFIQDADGVDPSLLSLCRTYVE